MLSVLSAFFVVLFFCLETLRIVFLEIKNTHLHMRFHFPEAFNHHRHLFDVFEKRLGRTEEESFERKAANSRLGCY